MKTLSEAVQMQIVEQAGSTFRTVVMSQLKDNRSESVIDAYKVTQFFINMMVKNLTEESTEVETPPTLDFLNITGVKNGS